LHREAASDYTLSIQLLSNPQPDVFLERARELVLAGDEYIQAALDGIDQGIDRLGPLLTLQLYAVELEVQLGHVDLALHRLDTAAEQSQRKERFLVQRGMILESAGQAQEAVDSYQAALAAIHQLPARHRHSKAVAELMEQIKLGLANLGQVED
jgi:predicted negative regulator of RcsB-dependent stress response